MMWSIAVKPSVHQQGHESSRNPQMNAFSTTVGTQNSYPEEYHLGSAYKGEVTLISVL